MNWSTILNQRIFGHLRLSSAVWLWDAFRGRPLASQTIHSAYLHYLQIPPWWSRDLLRTRRLAKFKALDNSLLKVLSGCWEYCRGNPDILLDGCWNWILRRGRHWMRFGATSGLLLSNFVSRRAQWSWKRRTIPISYRARHLRTWSLHEREVRCLARLQSSSCSESFLFRSSRVVSNLYSGSFVHSVWR